VLLSMTGFSSRLASLKLPKFGKLSVFIEMKTVNSRFFESTCRLPNSLSFLEIMIVNALQKKLVRGRLYLSIRFSDENEAFENISPSLKLIEGYTKAIKDVKKSCKVSGDLSVQDLFQLPNAFVFKVNELNKKEELLILNEVKKSSDMLMDTRKEEGDYLEKDLKQRFAKCGKQIEAIKKHFDSLMKSVKKDIDGAMVSIKSGDQSIQPRLDELYTLLNKIDIHEEIVRFKSHLKSINTLFKTKQIEKGRRFDFILQELLREINTIMSKCSNFEISSAGVDVKVELEKAREQVQNVL
jgi:uncharacterized protein (TIGR00255 family)